MLVAVMVLSTRSYSRSSVGGRKPTPLPFNMHFNAICWKSQLICHNGKKLQRKGHHWLNKNNEWMIENHNWMALSILRLGANEHHCKARVLASQQYCEILYRLKWKIHKTILWRSLFYYACWSQYQSQLKLMKHHKLRQQWSSHVPYAIQAFFIMHTDQNLTIWYLVG